MGLGSGSIYDYLDAPLHELSMIAEKVKSIKDKS